MGKYTHRSNGERTTEPSGIKVSLSVSVVARWCRARGSPDKRLRGKVSEGKVLTDVVIPRSVVNLRYSKGDKVQERWEEALLLAPSHVIGHGYPNGFARVHGSH